MYIHYDGKKLGPIKHDTTVTVETHSIENNIGGGQDARDTE